MKNNLLKVLNYKNQNYQIIGELNDNEKANLLKKYYISPFFKFKRFVKKIIFFCFNFFLKKKSFFIKIKIIKLCQK